MNNTSFIDREFIELEEYRGLQVGLKIPNGDLNIFVGINNAGKSRILECLNRKFGDKIDYISPDRLRVKSKPSFAFSQNIYDVIAQQAGSRKNHPEVGEIPGPDPIDEFVGLNDKDKKILQDWHNKYFEEMTSERTNKENSWEIPSIRIGGRTPGEQGSGSRAVFSLLVKLFDPKRPMLAIDEPEMSVEPPTQKKLFELIKMISRGENGLPKKQIFLATHSHLFLDRDKIENNFVVKKNNDEIKIEQITDKEKMYDTVFRLLGNNPTDLFFPSNIIVVEGPSDKIFLKKILSLIEDSSCSKNIVFHPAKGESQAPGAVITIDQMITTSDYLPVYKEKLCVLFDAQNGLKFINRVRLSLGDLTGERVRQLQRGSIELYFPKEIIKEICNFEDEEKKLDIEIKNFAENKQSTIGKLKLTKIELAQRVADRISSIDQIDLEIVQFLRIALDKAFK